MRAKEPLRSLSQANSAMQVGVCFAAAAPGGLMDTAPGDCPRAASEEWGANLSVSGVLSASVPVVNFTQRH